jgi:hypothetical protein
MEATQRLSLPMLIAGQAQKEVWHNEALQLLDTIVAAAVEEPPTNDPPASPAPGNCYVVGPSPTGEWSGYAGYLAAFSDAGWRFAAPVDGLAALVKSTATVATYLGGSWDVGSMRGDALIIQGAQVVGPQAPAISAPTGGTIVDTESRSVVDQILAALRQHGLIGR